MSQQINTNQHRCALVTLADENYIDQAKQFFSSAYHSNAWDEDFILLAHNIPKNKTAWFTQHGIIVYNCKPLFKGTPGGMSASLTSKFYMFGKDFRKYKTIVYVDADTTIRGNLNYLKEVKTFGAVKDYMKTLNMQFVRKGRMLGRKIKFEEVVNQMKEIGKNYKINGTAFSAGVFAFNPNNIAQDTQKKLIQFLKKYGDVSAFGEQLIFNLVFYEKWIQLPSAYNTFIIYEDLEKGKMSEEKNGIILHFTGDIKPWQGKKYFYKEWKNNLDTADEIDMRKSKIKITWSRLKIKMHTILN